MDFDDPLSAYFSDRPALEALIADGETLRVSSEIFMAAVGTGDVELVRLLLKAGGAALLDAFDDDLAWTPLMCAAKKGDVAMTTFLIDAGADVNAHDESRIGDTALLLAVQHGLLEIATILVARGADPSIPGWMGRTPLDHARDRKRMPELYELLLRAPRRRTQ